MRLLFVFYALGPAMLGYALAYLLRVPGDWSGPAVVIPLSLLVTALTQTAGTRWLRTKFKPAYQPRLAVLQASGLLLGAAIFGLTYFVLLR